MGETAAILGPLSGGAAVAAAFCGMNTVSVTSDQKWADVTRTRLEALAKEATFIADSKSSDVVGQLNEAQYFERYPEYNPGKPNVLMAPTLSSARSGKGIHRNIVLKSYAYIHMHPHPLPVNIHTHTHISVEKVTNECKKSQMSVLKKSSIFYTPIWCVKKCWTFLTLISVEKVSNE